ncbi:MAG: hypothetical protein ABI972_15030 [Acidobacteriota bacterium]
MVYNPQSPTLGKVNLWQEFYQDTVIIVFFAAIGLFLGIGGFLAFDGRLMPSPGRSETGSVAARLENGPARGSPLLSLGEVVELRYPSSSA